MLALFALKVRTAEAGVRDHVLRQLAIVVGLLRVHLADYMGEIVSIAELHFRLTLDPLLRSDLTFKSYAGSALEQSQTLTAEITLIALLQLSFHVLLSLGVLRQRIGRQLYYTRTSV